MSVVKKIDHIAIAVKDLDTAVNTFVANFGLPVLRKGPVPQMGINRAFLGIGDTPLELFQPTTPENPGTQFLADKGEGMYLLSLEVEDLAAAAAKLEADGFKVRVQEIPGGPKLGFVSPKQAHGVLLQLIQNPA